MTIIDKTWKSVEKQLKWHRSGKLINVHESVVHGAIQRLLKFLERYNHAKFHEHMLFSHHPHLDGIGFRIIPILTELDITICDFKLLLYFSIQKSKSSARRCVAYATVTSSSSD